MYIFATFMESFTPYLVVCLPRTKWIGRTCERKKERLKMVDGGLNTGVFAWKTGYEQLFEFRQSNTF